VGVRSKGGQESVSRSAFRLQTKTALVERGNPCFSEQRQCAAANGVGKDTFTTSCRCDAESISETPEKIVHGDIDYVKNSFFDTWNTPDFVTLTGQFESVKTRILLARQSNPGAELEPEIITLAGQDVIVNPSGVRIGKGVYYAYHLTFEGFDVFIHQDEKPKNDNPQIWFDIRAEARLNYGAYGAQQVMVDCLSQLGFTVESEKLSQVDVQVMIDVPVSAIVKLYLADHDVGGGHNFRINGKKKKWGKQIETLEHGDRKRIQFSAYDKRVEIAKKYNAETAAKYDKTIKREKPTRVSVDSERLENQGGGCLVGAAAPLHGKQNSVRAVRR